MNPDQELFILEAHKESCNSLLIWYLTRFTMYKEIPKNECEYYTDFIIHLKVELRKTKTEDEYNKVDKKITKLQNELEQKYGEKFIRYAKFRK